ncbi:Coiled-Coil Domain-Containing Protein 38 [Manis pentadactyla]|nr:Coiled-Coil Domain-Containing Protein 38 [Manis pentadactyla]
MNRLMKVHQKSTFSSRMKSRSHLGQIVLYSHPAPSSFEKSGLDPTLVLRLTERADTKRTVHEFINDQRDRFLLEYALSTKRNTIKKFERLIATKERQLIKAEKKLQEDAVAFEEFLRENDQKSADALKIEIVKTEFLLRDYMKYGLFLLKLSPKPWQIQQAMKRVQVSKSQEDMNVTLPKILTRKPSRKTKSGPVLILQNKKSSISNQSESISSEDSLELFLDDMDYDLEPELYFKEPEELLQVLTELEEQNLTLVQYSQDVEENLEDVNKREKLIQDKINSNIEFLLKHKEMLKANCEREEEKAAELELRSRLFSFGEFNSEAQEKLIDSLSKKINQVCKVCIGDTEVGGLDPVQKLVKVESRLVELSDLFDSIPKENVEAIERIKQKERRQKYTMSSKCSE